MDSDWGSSSSRDDASSGGGTAARDSTTNLDQIEWPILVVPGILGSRLISTKHGVIWDPDSKKTMLSLTGLTVNQLAHLFNPYRTDDVEVMTASSFWTDSPLVQDPELPGNAADRGWFGPSWTYYGAGILEIHKALRRSGAIVYAFGYDWRQCNQWNGNRLVERIREIVSAHGQKVHILTHSMGGLVTRSACKTLGARAIDLVGSVVHTFMPTIGAPEAYLKFKRGEVPQWGGWLPNLSNIIGSTPEEVAIVASGIRSLYQLLPTDRYPLPFVSEGGQRQYPWLVWDAHLADGLDQLTLQEPWTLYAEPSGTLGLVNHTAFVDGMKVKSLAIVDPRQRLQDILAGIRNASRFHRELGDYFHPCTLLATGNAIATPCGVELRLSAHADSPYDVIPKVGPGDGTVPEISAGFCRPILKKELTNVKHDAIFNDPSGLDLMIKLLLTARHVSSAMEQQARAAALPRSQSSAPTGPEHARPAARDPEGKRPEQPEPQAPGRGGPDPKKPQPRPDAPKKDDPSAKKDDDGGPPGGASDDFFGQWGV
jgi:pimeloyl-ACP methyl ester carboxylesterase